ncbi:MAG TPA: PqqD family protein [Gemmatimonadaceae bacterium]|nr:PqqD family protein [Gemmatimonadaceae bacterium]
MAYIRLPKPKSDLIFKTLADGGLIFSPELEVYFSVNAVGARVWNLLPPVTDSLETMVAMLAQEYTDVTSDVIRGDVEELLAEFAAQGLVEPLA